MTGNPLPTTEGLFWTSLGISRTTAAQRDAPEVWTGLTNTTEIQRHSQEVRRSTKYQNGRSPTTARDEHSRPQTTSIHRSSHPATTLTNVTSSTTNVTSSTYNLILFMFISFPAIILVKNIVHSSMNEIGSSGKSALGILQSDYVW